jgi:hypothetical protein
MLEELRNIVDRLLRDPSAIGDNQGQAHPSTDAFDRFLHELQDHNEEELNGETGRHGSA